MTPRWRTSGRAAPPSWNQDGELPYELTRDAFTAIA
jgi:hypothetical protein